MGHRGTVVIAGKLSLGLILFVAAVSATLISGAHNTSSPVTQIAQLCSREKVYTEQHKGDAWRFWAIPQNQNPARDHWRRVTSRSELDNAAKNADSTASVWIRDRKVVLVDAILQNQFGDSTQSVEYCFRADGTLAQLHSDLKSFHGGMRVVREIVFDDAGKQIGKTTRSFDLESGKAKKIPPDFWDFPPPIFLQVSDLPFAGDLPDNR